MTRRWTLRLVACLAAGAVVLTGCSEKQEAAQTLPSASSATPTEDDLPLLGPEQFPVPDEARAKSSEGALIFAKYYMNLGLKIGLGEAPAASLLALSTEDCRLCREVTQSFSDDQSAGFTRQGSTSSFEEYGPPLLAGDKADIGFVYTQSADRVIDRDGNEVPERAGVASGELQSGMQLTWRDDIQCWVVNSLTVG